VLKVAIGEAGTNARIESGWCCIEVDHFDDALDLPPRRQSKRDGADEPEQAVAADGQAKELRIVTATARVNVAAGVDQREGRDDTVDPRGVELRLNVVESRALRRREPPATAGQATDETTGDQELTSCQRGRPMSARGSRSPSARLRT